MSKTLQVASDRAHDETKSVLPAEYARGVFIEHPPSAQGLKLMHLMIATAGGALAEDRAHELRLAEVRRIKGFKNHDKASLIPLFREIRAATFSFDDPDEQVVRIGGFLDTAKIDYRFEDHGEIKVRWWFSRLFCEVAAKSNHWAIIDRQTVFALKSKYSILLFQYLASLFGLEHKASEIFTIPQLRAVLAVPEGKLSRWTHVNQFALKPALAEINQLSRFDVTTTPIKDGRHVDAVRLSWKPKADVTTARQELERSKIGRKARRDGTAEMPVAAFPETGGISYSPHWLELKRAAGCNKDNELIASDFRRFCRERNIALDARNIEKTFSDYCAKVGRV